ncbi:hypothetical protein LUX29_13130 [Aureimonas altamirensis]|uniref:hypothetical protein n=1 Tax=Aureimonas altamirensis TaxID=370622 RepID=UPI001E5DBBEF|nr:hypothetical protein [Aureimonas altamirensis]UHD44019.1 hypothetical protein LUX29_13130 [Aureimonas altamirensis]
MAEAGTAMNKPHWTSQINLGNIITLVVVMSGLAFGYGQLNNKIEQMEVFRSERTRQTDAKFAEQSALLRDIPNMSYRIAANEEALKATNARVEASISNISLRLAEINQALGSIDTKVAVLTQRLENADGRRASLRVTGPPD